MTSPSFTLKSDGRLKALMTEAAIGVAFDPSITAPPLLRTYLAIWDTGATNTSISKKVVDECDLKPIGMAQVHTAAGTKNCRVYFISIMLRNNVGFTQVRVTENEVTGADVLIGMDLITQGDFAITNLNGKTVFSFRCPSNECIDFVKSAQSMASLPKVGRNDPCPCGSGKKYKYCCGRKR